MIQDGYTDIPNGKIAAIITSLAMTEPPKLRPEPARIDCTLRQVVAADVKWYRHLYRCVGEDWLWFSRLQIPDEELGAIIRNQSVELYVVETGIECGLLELDFRNVGACELPFFGLLRGLRGKGVGRWLMNRAIKKAWSRKIRRFWVHTSTLDHPQALAFYLRAGFRAFRRQIEIADDPRLIGILPTAAAPQIPTILTEG
jgi:GNAT superfamily N-acetyltransferase